MKIRPGFMHSNLEKGRFPPPPFWGQMNLESRIYFHFLTDLPETQHLDELLPGLEFGSEFLFFFSFLNSNKSALLFARCFLRKNAQNGGVLRRTRRTSAHGKGHFWPIFRIFCFFYFLVFKIAFGREKKVLFCIL